MNRRRCTLLIPLLAAIACSQERPGSSAAAAGAGLDSLNARIEQAYRAKDPKAYAALYTDSAAFEWPAVETVRGPAGLEAMARSLWPPLEDLDLKPRLARPVADGGDDLRRRGGSTPLWAAWRHRGSSAAQRLLRLRGIVARLERRAHDGVRPVRDALRTTGRR